MIKFITTLLTLLCITGVHAQYAYFGTRGKIAFDKITFTKARIRSMTQQMDPSRSMRFGTGNLDNMPESSTQKLVLHFDESSTLLLPEVTAENATSTGRGNRGAGGGNIRITGGQGNISVRGNSGGGMVVARGGMGSNSKIMYQDLKKNISNLQLEIDQKYTITDSSNNITWRFTDEYRDIAGFECRRVNGATPDSLYIVAFYTDQIPVSAGPALTSGLPGMILGLAIPEMHIQYWATKVDYTNDTIPMDWKDKKATPITMDEFVKNIGRMYQRGRDSGTARRQVLEQLIY